MAGPFKVGDVVQLKSGGPKMTVTEELTDGKLRCAWFAGANGETTEEEKSPKEPGRCLKWLAALGNNNSPLVKYAMYRVAKREIYDAQQAANKRNEAIVHAINNETGVFGSETLILVAD